MSANTRSYILLTPGVYSYAYIYATSFFSLPITRASGEHLTHEEVVNKLDDDTVSYDVGVGYSGAFPEIFQVGIKVERQNFEVAVAWLRDLIYGSSFDKERCAYDRGCAAT